MSEPGATSQGEERAQRQARPGRGGPYLLLVPLAMSIAGVWWVRHTPQSVVPTRPPTRADPEAKHDVLGGETLCAGATLVFWLAPSEPDAERQVFQAKALRKRYGLGEGEPWRLRLEWRPFEEGQSSDVSLDVSRVAIDDEQGRALAPLKLGRELDPLATLLEPPSQPLTIGTSLDLVLWGRAPGPQARIVGLDAPPSTGISIAELNLSPRPLRIGDLVGPMARLDPEQAHSGAKPDGKSAPAAASVPPVRGSDDARY